jgi:hypothetical protein
VLVASWETAQQVRIDQGRDRLFRIGVLMDTKYGTA